MTDRIFQNHNSFEVSGKGRSVEAYVFGPEAGENAGTVSFTVEEDAGWDSQHAVFNMTAEEVTALKNFLIEQGY